MNIKYVRYRCMLLMAAMAAAIASWAQVTLGFEGEAAASVGIYVKDLRTGKVVSQNDAQRVLLPASTMKTITCATALDKLGPSYRFATPVQLYGSMSEQTPGLWNGNLVIVASGDPTIESPDFDDREPLWSEIQNALDQQGITAIDGRVIIREVLSDAGCVAEWEIDDVPWAYGAGLYGFNFNDNIFSIWPATGEMQPVVPGLEVEARNGESVNMERGINSSKLTVWGPNPRNPRWKVNASMPNPAAAYAYLLEDKLVDRGITVNGNELPIEGTPTVLCTHYSLPLSDIVRETLEVSHNLFAEGLLRAIAPGQTRKEAIDTELGYLKRLGLDTRYIKVCDGSGLARADRLSAQFLSDVLEAALSASYGELFADCLPLAGKEGTVKSLLKDTRLSGSLALKSGSMGAVQCFAGYKLNDQGEPTHTVVILVNGFYCPRAKVREGIEKFLLSIF